jgi:hypothetical protein
VTFERGVHERRPPTLKERTERARGHEERGGAANKNAHDEGERGEGMRDRGTMGGGAEGTTWEGVKVHMCQTRAKCAHKKTIPTEFKRFRNKNAKQMPRSSMRLKPRIPELFSDRNYGHVQVVHQKTDLSPQRADTRGFMPEASRAHVAPS